MTHEVKLLHMQTIVNVSLNTEVVKRLTDPTFIRQAIHQDAKSALKDHIMSNMPIAACQGNKVVWIEAKHIEIME